MGVVVIWLCRNPFLVCAVDERIDELGDRLIGLAGQSTNERASLGGEIKRHSHWIVFALWASFGGCHEVQIIRHLYAIKKNLRLAIF